MSEGSVQEKKVEFPKFFSPKEITYSTDLDKYEKLVYTYSCHSKLVGESSVILRPKLVTLLALYLQKGYSKETKKFAATVLDKKMPAINSMNLELRNLGLLLKDPMNTARGYLVKDLVTLKEYIEDEDLKMPLLLFKFVREKRG